LVAYDDVARRDLVLTKMDETGKAAAMKAIEAMETGGSTNLWGGLENGLELIREAKEDGKTAAVLVRCPSCYASL
jgi:Mg-chelatase subunit ChlD